MIDSEIKVSVIVPVYNAAEYLAPALDSIVDQTLVEIEIICVDDGSVDSSLEILKSYRERDGRVRILTENNAGPSVARNKGIVRARGKYIIFLDADDFYELSLLERLYNFAEENSLDIAASEYKVYDNSSADFKRHLPAAHAEIFEQTPVTSKNEHPDEIFESMTGYIWNKMFLRDFIIRKELLFDKDLFVFEDVNFVISALAMAERVGKLDDVLVYHRVYSDQTRARTFRKYYRQVPLVYKKAKEFLMHNGMYLPLSKSFLNFSAGRCFTIYNLLWQDGKEDFWNMLHESYAEIFDWHKHGIAEFTRKEIADFAMNVVLYDHKTFEKRLSRGRTIEPERFELLAKGKIKRKKATEIFGKIFKSKK